MFLQVVDASDRELIYEYVENNPFRSYIKNDIDLREEDPPGQNFNGPLLDTGSGVAYGPIHHWDDGSTDGIQHGYSWTSMPAVGKPTMTDNPKWAGDPEDLDSVSVTDSFSLYLMYKPTVANRPSVWIAVARVNWSWTADATLENNVWTDGGRGTDR